MRRALRKPEKVLLTTDAVGGVWTCMLDLAAQLGGRGIEVDLVVPGPAPSLARQNEAASLPNVRLSLLDIPLDWMAESSQELERASRIFLSVCRSSAPDIVHLNSPGLACLKRPDAPLVIGLHSCVATWWNSMYPATALPADLAWRADAIGKSLARADKVVVPSASFAREVVSVYGPRAACRVVRNGRSICPSVSAPGSRKRTGVFTSGRLWDEAKNFRTLDAAAERLSFPVRAAGPQVSPQGQRVDIHNIELTGEISLAEVRDHLASAAIFVSPSIYEPFGLSVLEAAQAGCALVLSDIPTFRELWSGAARFVEPRNPDAFRDALTELHQDERQRRFLAQEAQSRAAQYTEEAMCSELLKEVYQPLLKDQSEYLEEIG